MSARYLTEIDTIIYTNTAGKQVTITLYASGKLYAVHLKIEGSSTVASRTFSTERQANDYICELQRA